MLLVSWCRIVVCDVGGVVCVLVMVLWCAAGGDGLSWVVLSAQLPTVPLPSRSGRATDLEARPTAGDSEPLNTEHGPVDRGVDQPTYGWGLQTNQSLLN